MVVTLDAKRRLTVPTALAPARPGDYFEAHFDAEEDAIVFRRLGGRENWLAVMKECPVSPDDVFKRPGLKVFNPFTELPQVHALSDF